MADVEQVSEGDGAIIKEGAEHFRAFFSKVFEVTLDYDEEGICNIAEFIEAKRIKTLDDEEKESFVEAITYFLGEVIVRDFHAEWVIHEGALGLKFENGLVGFPESKVRKQFENGYIDNIYGFYHYCREKTDGRE